MNIYCFSTLSFAKLQFKSVINKVFHKHGVASFTDAWIETDLNMYLTIVVIGRIFYRCVDWNRDFTYIDNVIQMSHLLQMRGLKLLLLSISCTLIGRIFYRCVDWNIKFSGKSFSEGGSHLLQMRGLKQLEVTLIGINIASHLLQMRGLKP